MGLAVVLAAQQLRRSNGGGSAAMVVDRSHSRVPKNCIVLCFCLGKIGKIYSHWAHAIFYITPPLLYFLFTPHGIGIPKYTHINYFCNIKD
jgi:hypothetical protein